MAAAPCGQRCGGHAGPTGRLGSGDYAPGTGGRVPGLTPHRRGRAAHRDSWGALAPPKEHLTALGQHVRELGAGGGPPGALGVSSVERLRIKNMKADGVAKALAMEKAELKQKGNKEE